MDAMNPSSFLDGAKERGLTPKQARFCEEYLVDLNATQAAIRAGYSSQTANEQAAELLAKPSIRSRIDVALAEASKRTGVNQDRVIRELARIALADPLKVIDALDGSVKGDASADATAAIQSIRVKTIPQRSGEPIIEREVKLYDKGRALELLGKHLGLRLDRREITGPNGGPIQVQGRVSGLTTAELEALLRDAKDAKDEPKGGGADGPAGP